MDVLLLIGLSVLMHVTWNLMARHVNARCNYLWWGLLAHLLLLGPVGIYGLVVEAHWSWTLVGMAAITMTANSLYFVGLRHAYTHAPAAYVYPLARSSPLLILWWSWLLLGEVPSSIAMLGIVVSMMGLWWLATSGKDHAATRAALPWVVLAAVSTSIYSLSDKVAIAYLPSLASAIGFVSLGYLASFCLLSVLNWRQSGRVIPPCRPAWRYLLTGGLSIGTAYALVIQSMQYLPAAYVVSFSNTGIVLASLLSVVLLKEREHWQQRLLAAMVVGLGLLILGLA